MANMTKPHIVIISPYLANANNGNWQTAWRWFRFLNKDFRVTLEVHWDGLACDAMIALHARRSADSISAYAKACPANPLIVVLTGTDLYKDIYNNETAQHSIQVATQLIILQPGGLEVLDKILHPKTQIIYQSAPSLIPISLDQKKRTRFFDVIMVGHLRDEKDPGTFMHAAQLVESTKVRMIHIGNALEPALGAQAEITQKQTPRYHWLGNVDHSITRQRLKRSHLMVITSKMEGGANVIIEAMTSGVPVLASDISGNRGMLGDHYDGYFPLGDSLKLARLIDRAATDSVFYRHLKTQCDSRAPLFSPDRERRDLLKLINYCIAN